MVTAASHPAEKDAGNIGTDRAPMPPAPARICLETRAQPRSEAAIWYGPARRKLRRPRLKLLI